jgi:hypothetical protein
VYFVPQIYQNVTAIPAATIDPLNSNGKSYFQKERSEAENTKDPPKAAMNRYIPTNPSTAAQATNDSKFRLPNLSNKINVGTPKTRRAA